MNDPDDAGLNDQPYVVDGPDDTDQPCPHGDSRSCVVDGCRPLRHVHVAGVIVPPAPRIACLWCGEDSERGQCGPCAALLDAIRAAPRAGVIAIVAVSRSEWKMQPREADESVAGAVLQSTEVRLTDRSAIVTKDIYEECKRVFRTNLPRDLYEACARAFNTSRDDAKERLLTAMYGVKNKPSKALSEESS